ncbi:MAG TPA: hypothetical protein VFZ25_15620, partial [Chloroflexota bacterium]|nr:hypothetical protein [Chloroflexota bacterium]
RATEKERELARRLLAAEGDGNASPADLAASTVRVLNRFAPVLDSLIEPIGYEALLRRALHLTRTEWPFLLGVRVRVNAEGVHLPGLVESVRDQDPTTVRDGLVAIVANLIWLLVTFVGEAICAWLIQRAFGEAPPGPGDAGSKGKR